MRNNPFSLDDAPHWLDKEKMTLVRKHLLKNENQDLLLPWQLPKLKGRGSRKAIAAFFSEVTSPLVETVDILYTSQLLRSEKMVAEILRRMACAVGRRPLPLEVVQSICALFVRQSADLAPDGEKVFELQEATWQLSWHQSFIPIHYGAETWLPIVLLVTDKETGKVLSFRCTSSLPTSEELGLALYDALVYPQMVQAPLIMHLRPPTSLQVQGSLTPEIAQVAQEWSIDVTTLKRTKSPFLRQLEAELTDRALDLVHYLRIFDRACERTFGYAPFLQKQRFARWVGWYGHQVFDPAWHFAGLRSLLPSSPVGVSEDGILEWRGWHYRDMEDILPYWAHEMVTVRPSSWTEAMVWVYWNNSILCNAIADELRASNGSYRPYWFPYPQLGE